MVAMCVHSDEVMRDANPNDTSGQLGSPFLGLGVDPGRTRVGSSGCLDFSIVS